MLEVLTSLSSETWLLVIIMVILFSIILLIMFNLLLKYSIDILDTIRTRGETLTDIQRHKSLFGIDEKRTVSLHNVSKGKIVM